MISLGDVCIHLYLLQQEARSGYAPASDDLWLTLTFLGKVKFAVWTSVWEEFMELVKDFGAKVNSSSSSSHTVQGPLWSIVVLGQFKLDI